MNRTSRTPRFLCGVAAAAITGVLFQGVAGLSRPTAIEQMAAMQASAVTVASIGIAPAVAARTGVR